jgi:hypothetical protein
VVSAECFHSCAKSPDVDLYTSFFGAQIAILTIAVPVAVSVLSATTQRYSVRLASQLLRDKALWALATVIAALAVPSAIGIATPALGLETPSLTPPAVLAALPIAVLCYLLLIARAVHVLQPSRVIDSAVRRTSHAALRQQALTRYGGDTKDNAEDHALVGASEIARRAVDEADVRALKAFTHALVARLLVFAAEAARRRPAEAADETRAVVRLVLSDYFEPLFRRAAGSGDPWLAAVVVKAVQAVGTADIGEPSGATALATSSLLRFRGLVAGSAWADSLRARIDTAVDATRASALTRGGQPTATGGSLGLAEAEGETTGRSSREVGSSS